MAASEATQMELRWFEDGEVPPVPEDESRSLVQVLAELLVAAVDGPAEKEVGP